MVCLVVSAEQPFCGCRTFNLCLFASWPSYTHMPLRRTIFNLSDCLNCLRPYAAQVEVVKHNGKWEANNMLKVTRVCKQIKELHAVGLTTGRSGVKTVLQGMLQLRHLQSLTVKVIDDKELKIIGEMLQLRELELTLGPKCTVAGLLQLEKLKEQGQLQELAVGGGEARISNGEWEELRIRLSVSRRRPVG